MQPNIEELKKAFTKEIALEDAVQSAMRRNTIYSSKQPDDKKIKFKEHWKQCLVAIAGHYQKPVSDDDHCKAIVVLSDRMTRKYEKILYGNRFRIGTAQKSLNVYLKHLWCMGKISTLVHCTIDRVILQAAGIYGAWTKCDDINQYKVWIDRLENAAKKENLKLAEWELVTWRPVSKNA